MARTCVLTASDTTPTAGQEVTITATFSNDGDEVDIDSVESLIAVSQAGLFEQMTQKLVGQTLAPDDGSPGETAITFNLVPFTGQPASFTLTIDLAVVLSDATVVNATGVNLTVSPVTLVGGSFPE